MSIAAIWLAWSGPLHFLGGALTAGGGALFRAWAIRNRNRLDAGAQALELVQIIQRREQITLASYERAAAYEMDARARAHIAADTLQDVHAEAIGARLRCHDLEMRFRLPLTDFPPFPAFPFREMLPTTEADAPQTTGAAAAAAAEPGVTSAHG
ncbi:hypothetical protein [Brytella acorum]|uniref:Uncharacterized protein n=1 Tax=Brytella acorum TaxID=2959299 RepID=A0AA35XW47_9PROT|nr:hypothetical protein [Brytella acorum]CAI9120448.1 hypothetical protein LMG32879_001281 [Brytella acorum]